MMERYVGDCLEDEMVKFLSKIKTIIQEVGLEINKEIVWQRVGNLPKW